MRYSTNNKLLVNSGEHVNVITQIIVKANKVFVDHTSLAYIHTHSLVLNFLCAKMAEVVFYLILIVRLLFIVCLLSVLLTGDISIICLSIISTV